jgi:oligosaccharyltransferase complex subunit beta
VVDYWRHGLTFLNEESPVSIIQWRHDAFPRYLTRAYPFYLSVFLLMAGFFLVVVSFLFSDVEKKDKIKTK